MQSTTTQHLDAAIRYADFGWSVLPLRGKRPLHGGWAHFSIESPTKTQLQAWWTETPDANIGCVCGPASGVLVLDVDGSEGLESLEEFEFPPTPHVRTGNGGFHFYFQHPEGVKLHNGVKLLPGLDIRTTGGQAVLPPSIHPDTGQPYVWEIAPAGLNLPGADGLPEADLAPVPGWLLDLARQREERPAARPLPPNGIPPLMNRIKRASAYLTQIPGAVSGQGGHDQTWSAALAIVKGFDLPEDVAFDLLWSEYNGRCQPPWSEREMRHKVTEAAEATAEAGYLLRQNSGAGSNGRPPHLDGRQTGAVKLQTAPAGDNQRPRHGSAELVGAPKGGTTTNKLKMRRQSVPSLRAAYKPTRFLVEGILPVGSVALIGGPAGIGKTWLELDMACAIATGSRWLGRFGCEQGRVLLVMGEEDSNSLLNRIDLISAGRGWAPGKADTLPVELLIQQPVQVVDPEGNLDSGLEAELREFQPDLLIIDPFRRVHGLDENDSRVMNALFLAFRQLTQVPDNTCSVLLIHHLRKRGEFDDGSGLDRLRGSSDIGASLDSALEIAGEFENILRVRHVKSKRGPSVENFMVRPEISEKAVKLAYIDPKEEAEKDRQEGRGFVLQLLRQAPEGVNQSKLWDAGKEYHIGRDRLKKVCEELQSEGVLEIVTGPRNSKLYQLRE